VKLDFPPPDDFHLIELGPKSATYKHAPGTDPTTWVKSSPPTSIAPCAMSPSPAFVSAMPKPICPSTKVVRVIEQKPNPDYPKTTPRGGMGKGIWIR
jgi:hypothetical protein